jgi:alpha-glucosidase
MAWLDAPEGVLAFRRGTDFACVINYSDSVVALPDTLATATVLIASTGSAAGTVAANSAIWLETD